MISLSGVRGVSAVRGYYTIGSSVTYWDESFSGITFADINKSNDIVTYRETGTYIEISFKNGVGTVQTVQRNAGYSFSYISSTQTYYALLIIKVD